MEKENTLAAFRRARRMGADAVELDVRRTADGAMAIHHDAALADGRLICETDSSALTGLVSFLPEAFGALTAALRCAALRRVSFGGFWRRLWDGAKNEGGLRRLSALHSIWVSFCCR